MYLHIFICLGKGLDNRLLRPGGPNPRPLHPPGGGGMRPGGIPNNNQGSLLGQLRPGPGGNNRQPVGGLLGGVGVPTARGGPGGVGGSVGVGKKPDMPS